MTKAKRKLNELNNFISNISDNSDKVVNYFNDNRNFIKPFYDFDDLLKSLRIGYAEKIKLFTKLITEKNREQGIDKKLNKYM